MVDSWEDQDNDSETSREKKTAVQRSNKSNDNDEEVPAKRPKLVDVDDDSDDDFAAQLLEGQCSNSPKLIPTDLCNLVGRMGWCISRLYYVTVVDTSEYLITNWAVDRVSGFFFQFQCKFNTTEKL